MRFVKVLSWMTIILFIVLIQMFVSPIIQLFTGTNCDHTNQIIFWSGTIYVGLYMVVAGIYGVSKREK